MGRTLLCAPRAAGEKLAGKAPQGNPLAEGMAGRWRGKPPNSQEKSIHLKLLPQLLISFFSFRRHRDIEILPLLLAQQLKPGGTQRERRVRMAAGPRAGRTAPPAPSTALPLLHRPPGDPSPRLEDPSQTSHPQIVPLSKLPATHPSGGCFWGPSLYWGPSHRIPGRTSTPCCGGHHKALMSLSKHKPDPKTRRKNMAFS